jgi:hypothetical protein
MKKLLFICAFLPLTGCMTTSNPNYYEPVKHRRTIVEVSRGDKGFASNYSAWRAVDAHAPASWRGTTYSYCGYFAAHASKAENSGVTKLGGTSPDDLGRIRAYYFATHVLTTSPECLTGATVAAADGNLIASVNLIRMAATAIPPEVEALGVQARFQYNLAILNRLSAEDMAPLLKDGRFAAVVAARNKYVQTSNSGNSNITAKFD